MKNLSVLHDMALFVEVARTGSFSRASLSLGMPGATLSRRIAGMEKQLGVRLFDRSTRRVELTTAGRRYFERCAALVDEARLAEEARKEVASHADGHLRVSMPVDLGVHVVGPLLPDFARAYPGITFDIDLSPRHAEVVGEHADVAIALGPCVTTSWWCGALAGWSRRFTHHGPILPRAARRSNRLNWQRTIAFLCLFSGGSRDGICATAQTLVR